MSEGDTCDWCHRTTRQGLGGWQRTTFLDNAFVCGSDVGGHLFCSWSCLSGYAAMRHENPQGGLYAQDQYMADFRDRQAAQPPGVPMTPGLQYVETGHT